MKNKFIELIQKERENKKNIRKLVRYIIQKSIIFNSYLANSQSVSYTFARRQQQTLTQKQKVASKLLSVSFLKMGSLISKPTFKLVVNCNENSSAVNRQHLGAFANTVSNQSLFLVNHNSSSSSSHSAQAQLQNVRHSTSQQQTFNSVSTEDLIMSIEKSQEIFLSSQKFDYNQKWTIRLFFYIRNPLICYKNKKNRAVKQKTISNLPKLGLLTSKNKQQLQTLQVDAPNSIGSTLQQLRQPAHLQQEMSFSILQSKTEYNFLEIYRNNITYLVKELSNIFKTDIELELIQLKKSYHNSNILAQHLNLRSYKYRFVKLINRFLKRFSFSRRKYRPQQKELLQQSNQQRQLQTVKKQDKLAISSNISGVRIKLGGRTFKQRIIPRKTVQQIQRGSLAKDKVKFVEKSRVTGKTRRGAYSFTVTLGHVIV